MASSVGWAKWVPRRDPVAHRLDDRRVGVAGDRGAVAAVQVDVLVAVDVVDLGALAVAHPHRLRLGDLPVRRRAAGQVCARRRDQFGAARLARAGTPAPRRRSAGRRCRSLGCRPPSEDTVEPPLCERLTEHSVYARVLPATRRRKQRGGPRCQQPTHGPTRDNSWRARRFSPRSAPALGAFLQACSKSGAVVLGSPSLTLGRARQPGQVAHRRRQQADRRRARAGEGRDAQDLQLRRLPQPAGHQEFEDKYGDQDGGIDLQRQRRGDHQDPQRSRLRHLQRQLHQISRLVNGELLRPLNHTYIPNIKNVWPSFTNPWYDQEWRYTVPYTIYTTGIGWRTDQVPADIGALKNPYDSLWDPVYKGKTAVIDDFHTAMAMVLLRQGITDINTSSEADLKMVGEQLQRAGEGHLAEGHHHDVQRPSRRPTRDLRRCGRATSSTRSPTCPKAPARNPAVLVPCRRQGHGRQRHAGDAARRQEPGARAPVHQPHARPRSGQGELLAPSVTSRHRTPSPRTRSSQRNSSPRTCAQRS